MVGLVLSRFSFLVERMGWIEKERKREKGRKEEIKGGVEKEGGKKKKKKRKKIIRTSHKS